MELTEKLKKEMKEEALLILKSLRLYTDVIEDFERGNVLYASELIGMLCWLNAEEKEYVQELEKEKNILVYHVIKSITDYGDMNSYLFISPNQEEWEYNRECLEQGIVCAYVQNMQDEEMSEFGNIGIMLMNGGLIRTF